MPPIDPMPPDPATTAADPTEITLSDADILQAMHDIPGYLDITTADFRTLYRLAHRHALERLWGRLNAGQLLRRDIAPLAPATPLIEAVTTFTRQGLRTLPVIDPDDQVIGVFTETDVLRALGAKRPLDLLAHLIERSAPVEPRMLETQVGTLMTHPAVCVPITAGIHEILAAFTRHPGRSMPVLAPDGRLAGLLRRKDVLRALNLEDVS